MSRDVTDAEMMSACELTVGDTLLASGRSLNDSFDFAGSNGSHLAGSDDALAGFTRGAPALSVSGDRIAAQHDAAPEAQTVVNAPIKTRNVYVGALPVTFTERDLASMLNEFGKLKSCRMFNTGTRVAEIGRAYGFALFEDATSAERAVEALNGKPLGTARIQCRLSRNGVLKKPKKQFREAATLKTPSPPAQGPLATHPPAAPSFLSSGVPSQPPQSAAPFGSAAPYPIPVCAVVPPFAANAIPQAPFGFPFHAAAPFGAAPFPPLPVAGPAGFVPQPAPPMVLPPFPVPLAPQP